MAVFSRMNLHLTFSSARSGLAWPRWALARAGGDGVASVAPGVYSENVDIRRRAVLAIAEMSGDEATAVLADALGDSDTTVRRHAALASGTRGATAAVPTLVGMVVEGTNLCDEIRPARRSGGLLRGCFSEWTVSDSHATCGRGLRPGPVGKS